MTFGRPLQLATVEERLRLKDKTRSIMTEPHPILQLVDLQAWVRRVRFEAYPIGKYKLGGPVECGRRSANDVALKQLLARYD